MRSKEAGRSPVLLSAGLLVISGDMFLMRHLPSSLHSADFIKGVGMGAGIGLMLVALVLARKHSRSEHPGA